MSFLTSTFAKTRQIFVRQIRNLLDKTKFWRDKKDKNIKRTKNKKDKKDKKDKNKKDKNNDTRPGWPCPGGVGIPPGPFIFIHSHCMCFRPCQCIVLDEQNMLAVVSYACRGHCILAVQQSENYAKTLENQAK